MSNEHEMHEQHQAQNHDHADWLRDISRWRVDHRMALAILNRVEATIHEFDAEMEAHAGAIRDHHLHITHHEKELASHASDQHPEVHEMYRRAHDEAAATHENVRERHAELAAKHQQMMENLAALFEALADD